MKLGCGAPKNKHVRRGLRYSDDSKTGAEPPTADPDLAALWEEHCRYEFEIRDVDATMATMVDRPYVNHIPTMAGGVGHDELKDFYKYHFIGRSIGRSPEDVTMTLVSRTVGA